MLELLDALSDSKQRDDHNPDILWGDDISASGELELTPISNALATTNQIDEGDKSSQILLVLNNVNILCQSHTQPDPPLINDANSSIQEKDHRDYTKLKSTDTMPAIIAESTTEISMLSEHEDDIGDEESSLVTSTASTVVDGVCSRRVLISQLSLKIYRGMRLLIVGPSGCGKTTLLRQLAGFYEEAGMDKKCESIKHYLPRSKVLFLPQDAYCFQGSLEANVCYPRPHDMSSDSNSCQRSEFNRTLFDTALEETGLAEIQRAAAGLTIPVKDMSGGQRQRVSFARAIYSQAELVFLDEQSCSVESATESLLYSALSRHCQTYVSIGHRETLRKFHSHLLTVDNSGHWALQELQQES
mmetsp:Transcript_11715/g.19088  ORF Transcript_11715/g.19088 Transcript_11715/m.19088 type:complete len:358 (-) Transcript_11715:156-1229(-)